MVILNVQMFICVLVTSILPILVSIIFGPRVSKAELDVSRKNESFLSYIKDILVGFPVIKSFRT